MNILKTSELYALKGEFYDTYYYIKKKGNWGDWVAQLGKRLTLDLSSGHHLSL